MTDYKTVDELLTDGSVINDNMYQFLTSLNDLSGSLNTALTNNNSNDTINSTISGCINTYNNILNTYIPSLMEGHSKTLDYMNVIKNTAAMNIANYEVANAYSNIINYDISSSQNALEIDTNNKIRMAQINEYYNQKQLFINNILKTSVFFIFLLLIIIILTKISLLSNNLSLTIGIILTMCYIIYIIIEYMDLNKRNNFIFSSIDQYIPDSSNSVRDEYDNNYLVNMPFLKSIYDAYDEWVTGSFNIKFNCNKDECCAPGTTFNEISGACYPI